MNFKEIKELIGILNQSSLTGIDIEDNKDNVANLKEEKETKIVTPQAVQQPIQPINHMHNKTQQKPSHGSKDEQSSDSEYDTINTPMASTFYKSPSPDEEAYVQIEDKVTNESTVCVLEAMKLFNEIQTETTDEIIGILVEDGQVVKYGQSLFKVK